jgi:predicted neuraminidase
MFIFEKAPFSSCHASTVVEHEPGKLMAAWFGGDREGARNVQVWASSFEGATWSEPGQPCWNPVLFKTAKGTLFLWYKGGPSPQTWTGFERKSTDGGKTWTKPAMMPAGMWGPVRAKPIQLKDGTILAGTSVGSHRNWTPYVDRSTDDGTTWLRSSPFPVPGKMNQIQPTLFEAEDGRIVALMRSRDPRKVCRAESKDGGKTFTPAEETEIPNPSTGLDVVKTGPRELFLVYNHTPIGRTPLSLARSTDDGKSWKKVKDLETELGEYSYPAMILSAAGKLEITYSWRRTHIKHERVDPATLR